MPPITMLMAWIVTFAPPVFSTSTQSPVPPEVTQVSLTMLVAASASERSMWLLTDVTCADFGVMSRNTAAATAAMSTMTMMIIAVVLLLRLVVGAGPDVATLSPETESVLRLPWIH